MQRRPSRVVIGVVASLVVTVPLGVLWARSLVPGTYSVMDMGYHDFGGGPGEAGHDAHALAQGVPEQPGALSVTELTGPQSGPPDVEATLVARQEPIASRSVSMPIPT